MLSSNCLSNLPEKAFMSSNLTSHDPDVVFCKPSEKRSSPMDCWWMEQWSVYHSPDHKISMLLCFNISYLFTVQDTSHFLNQERCQIDASGLERSKYRLGILKQGIDGIASYVKQKLVNQSLWIVILV